MPSPITQWQTLDSVSGARSVDEKWGHRSSSAFGNRYLYEGKGSPVKRSFQADLVALDEADAIIAAYNTPLSESGSTVTLRVHGVNWTGKVWGMDLKRELALDYYAGTVTLDNPTKE